MNSKYTKWIMLFIGMSGLFMVSPAVYIGAAGWIYPVGLLYFIRKSKPIKGFFWGVFAIMLASSMSGALTSPLPLIAVIATSPISGFLDMLPFLIDRLLFRRLRTPFNFLVLPIAGVVYEYLVSFVFGSVGALGASQSKFLTFIQLSSVTGVFGISFMMYWFASLAVQWIEGSEIKNQLKLYTATLSVIMIFGWVKLATSNQTAETVRVSGITVEIYDFWEGMYFDMFGEEITMDIHSANSPEQARLLQALPEVLQNPESPKFKKTWLALDKVKDRLLQNTIAEANRGAKFIVWSETNLPIFQKDKNRIVAEIQNTAKACEAYILASTAVLLPYEEDGPLYENESLLISPTGEILDEFQKAKPVPMMDASLPGDGQMDVIKTPYGKVTNAICYDGDFPNLIIQSAKSDILLLPSKDWLEISPFHGDLAVFRAIENGVSIVRPTSTGQSTIYDPDGRVLARLDAFDREIRIINGHVPQTGRTTLYGFIGDLFSWICLVMLICLVVMPFTKFRNVEHELQAT